MSQIRITKTLELESILTYLRSKWILMDDVEIVKMSLSNFYQDQTNSNTNDDNSRYPDPQELSTIEEHLANPQTIGVKESAKFTQSLKDYLKK